MPRDSSQHEQGLVDLPGGRIGKLVPSDSAGQFRIALLGNTLIDRLAEIGAISREELQAGQHLAELFEQTTLRPSLTGSYLPPIDGGGAAFGLERLNGSALAAWRRLGELIAAAPPASRGSVVDACLWDRVPGSLRRLQTGLAAVAAITHPPRRR